MLALTCALLLGAAAEAPSAVDTVVVCPPHFAEALQPWLNYRRAQGHTIAVVSHEGSPAEIRGRIRRHSGKGLRFVVLVGDAEPGANRDAALRARTVATEHRRAIVNVRFGSEPEIASDNGYADVDGDHLPDVAVGRLTADSPRELSTMVNKILAYERMAAGTWQQRISFVAGVGGFGRIADSVLEMTTRHFLTQGIPNAYTTSMTYASWRSPYCPDPRRFHEATVNRFNEGCLFWVYIGHGQKTFLDQVQVPGRRYHILDCRDSHKFRNTNGSPIAIFLACYTGAYDQPQDCIAEELLRAPGGPAAILSGSRVTMPYAMAVLGDSMMREYFTERRQTIGEVMLHAKRRMMLNPTATSDATANAAGPANQNRRLLDALASVLSPSRKMLDAERREHLWLFNLLGDPLMRLHYPGQVQLHTAERVRAGKALQVRGHCGIAGQCTVELVCRRDRTRHPVPARVTFNQSDDNLRAFQDVYRRANDHRWTAREVAVSPGDFQLELEVPDEVRGPCHLRAFVQGDKNYALGATDVFVEVTAPAEN